jgi:siroheme synthase
VEVASPAVMVIGEVVALRRSILAATILGEEAAFA